MKARTVAAAALIVVTAALAVRSADTAPAAPAKPSAKELNGYRGYSVAVNGAQLEFLHKGDRVDVLVTFDATMEDKSREKVTATILQNVLLLDLRRSDKPDQLGIVDLVVNPNEAQYLALAFKQGEVQVVRRFEGDKAMKPMEMASFRKLFR